MASHAAPKDRFIGFNEATAEDDALRRQIDDSIKDDQLSSPKERR